MDPNRSAHTNYQDTLECAIFIKYSEGDEVSEQARILEEMQALVMGILQSGSATVEEGERLDELEAMMLKQKCYKEIEHPEHDYQGEEIATLFFNDSYMEAIDKMYECKITPDDFFGFVEYHYDEDEEDAIEMFTDRFIEDVNKVYQSKCQA